MRNRKQELRFLERIINSYVDDLGPIFLRSHSNRSSIVSEHFYF
ncbi:Uncharacterised protein [uncultured archaeon]|nr:Uncharacterised protein [uncultured archaeon]